MYITKGKRRLWYHSSLPAFPEKLGGGGDEGKGKKCVLLGFSACVALYQYPQIASERSLSVLFFLLVVLFSSLFLNLFCFVLFRVICFWLEYMSLTWPFLSCRRGGAAGCSQAKFHNDRRSQGTSPQFHLYQIDLDRPITTYQLKEYLTTCFQNFP